MTLPDSPLAWFLVIVLSLLSTLFCWTGMRGKNIPHLLWGLGLAIPTFDILSWKLWLGGAVVCGLGALVQGKLNGL